jgi:FlaA1/EpsC-like NDP-sugar epimerase
MLNDKKILITGGSGTIGTALIKFILKNYEPNVIRVFSRDETKQYILKKHLKQFKKQIRFLIGDIRDKERLKRAMKNVDLVFHLAALKHVVACEYNPFEAIKTNVIGLQNLIDISIENNIEKVVFTSTDKAATPCNTMGVTKLLGEKLITTANYYKGKAKTIFYSVRFGNVLGSRGSLIPLIKRQIEKEIPITLTHKNMTRYIMDINSAVKLIIDTLKFAQGGEVFVLKMDAVKIYDLIKVIINNLDNKNGKDLEKIEIKEIGMFAGEKLYEELFSIEEAERTYEINGMYIISPQITEISKKLDFERYPNIKKFDTSKPFNSQDAYHLSKEDIKDYLIDKNILKS